MTSTNEFRIALLPGDGIGSEVIPPCTALMERALQLAGGPSLRLETLRAGAACYRDTGEALPGETMAAVRAADAILLGAMGLPSVRYPDGTEISPQLDIRFELGLYAGVRPVRTIPGLPQVLSDDRADGIDFVLIRESTEGLFASHGKGTVSEDSVAEETLVITRAVSEKLFDFALNLGVRRKAQGHPGKVLCVDKANVFTAFAFFRQIFDERAGRFDELDTGHAYVDAIALDMVRQPWNLDVLVTENMFGDILSDLGAGLIGGMGMAPSADIGDRHAVFQPCHGSAPDIAGQGKANPVATFLSGAMMLDWLGEQHDEPSCGLAGSLIRSAVDRAFSDGDLLPTELGGRAGTRDITDRVMSALNERAVLVEAAVG